MSTESDTLPWLSTKLRCPTLPSSPLPLKTLKVAQEPPRRPRTLPRLRRNCVRPSLEASRPSLSNTTPPPYQACPKYQDSHPAMWPRRSSIVGENASRLVSHTVSPISPRSASRGGIGCQGWLLGARGLERGFAEKNDRHDRLPLPCGVC